MTASRADVQAKIDAAVAELKKTTSSGAKMVSQYGGDPTKWPSGHWQTAMADLAAARAEVGLLVDPTAPPPTPTPDPGWTNMLNVDFSTKADGFWDPGWCKYGGFDQVYKQGYYSGAHTYVQGGLLHLLAKYESSGPNGAAWYTGGFSLHGGKCGDPAPYPFGSIGHRLTVRQRIVENGAATMGHRNILLWPEPPVGSGVYHSYGECDMWESQGADTDATLYCHYGSGTGDYQIVWKYPTTFNWTDWHTFRFVRVNYTVSIFIDDLTTPIHTYAGNSTTLPDHRLYWAIQQQMRQSSTPPPSGDSEDWQIASLQLDKAA